MLVNQIAHHRRLGTAQRFGTLIQKRNVPAIHFQRDGFHVPKVLPLRQQVNTGIIVVLDNRILTKQYGQSFLDALPKCPVEIV